MGESDAVESCQLIGFAGIMIQLVLGALSFSVLIYKRYLEKPKRAWRIWAMDTSKQGVSQFLAHVINVAISMQLSSKLQSDACIWYFTTNILDNTLGVVLCVTVLGLIEKHILSPNYVRFQSGNYYTVAYSFEEERSMGRSSNLNSPLIIPLQISSKKAFYTINYFDWFVQFTIWNMIVILAKSLMFELEILLSEPLISISTFLLGWIQPYQTFELILVIIIVPVIMNGFAFWFQDNFLKKKETEQADPPQTVQAQEKNQQARTTVAEPEHKVEPQPQPDIKDNLL